MAPLEMVRTLSHDILPDVPIPSLGMDETQLTVLLDPTAPEAREIALAFTRALHNLPNDAGFTSEQVDGTRSVVGDFREATFVFCMSSVASQVDTMLAADPTLEQELVPPPYVPILDGDGSIRTGGLLPPIQELADAAKKYVERQETGEEPARETYGERRRRLHTAVDVAKTPHRLTIVEAAVVMTGLKATKENGDKADVIPENITATKTESQVLLEGLARAIYLPAGNHFLKLSWG